MNNLDRNLIVLIALELDLPEISSLGQLNKRFNSTICESDIFWFKKIKKDHDFEPKNYKKAKKYYKIIVDRYFFKPQMNDLLC